MSFNTIVNVLVWLCFHTWHGTYPHADGPCANTSGDPHRSEIHKTFAKGCKVPSYRAAPWGGCLESLLRRWYVQKIIFCAFYYSFCSNKLSSGWKREELSIRKYKYIHNTDASLQPGLRGWLTVMVRWLTVIKIDMDKIWKSKWFSLVLVSLKTNGIMMGQRIPVEIIQINICFSAIMSTS